MSIPVVFFTFPTFRHWTLKYSSVSWCFDNSKPPRSFTPSLYFTPRTAVTVKWLSAGDKWQTSSFALIPTLPLPWSSEVASLRNSRFDSLRADVRALLSHCHCRRCDGELGPSIGRDVRGGRTVCGGGRRAGISSSGIWGRCGVEGRKKDPCGDWRSRVSFYRCAIPFFLPVHTSSHVSLLSSLLIQSHQGCRSSWRLWMKRGF